MQRDLQPAGKVVAEALKTRDWGAAKKRLAGILKDCGTESAGVIEEAMRGDGGEATKGTKEAKGKDGQTEELALANVTDANGIKHADKSSQEGGQFVSKDGGESPRDQADTQARELGYKDRNDLLDQAAQVS